jgi:alkaline phosphatase D
MKMTAMAKFILTLAFVLAAHLAQASERLTGGPMPGYPAMRSARIWLQASGAADAQIEYWPEGKPSERWKTESVELLAENDYSTHVEITDLQPGQNYEYRVLIDGQPQSTGETTLRFKTVPLWQFRGPPPNLTIALGSCAYINDDPYDRPGEPYGGEFQIFDSIAQSKPDLMLWMGDNIYLREVDYDSPSGMNYRYRQARSFPPLQRLLQSTHHIATWDDHDYGPDNSNSSFALKESSLQLFKRYWANPSYGQPGVPGVFTSFSYGDMDFFLLDDRYYRDHDNQPESAGKQMFGEAQLRWLKNALMASDANFKFVVNGSQVLMSNRRSESWKNFTTEQAGFLDWLARAKIGGVVFLSGDRHMTKMAKYPRTDLYPLYELTCSPLTSGFRDPSKDTPDPHIIPETVVGARNFCTLAVSGESNKRVLTVSSHDSNGKQLWERSIEAAELR